MTSLVQSEIGNSMYLSIITEDVDGAGAGWNFSSRSSSNPGPTLTLDYTAIPEPSTFALVAGSFALCWITMRRRLAQSRK
jgi:hypothetical protein